MAVDVVEHVLARDASSRARAVHGTHVNTVIIDESTHDGRQQGARRRGSRHRCGNRCRCRRGNRSRCGFRSRRDNRSRCRRRRDNRSRCRRRRGNRCRCRRWCGSRCRRRSGSRCRAGSADHRNHGADRHGVTLLHANLGQGPGNGRRHLGVHLVGRHFEQRFVGGDGVAHLLEPPRDGPLRDGLAQLRKCDLSHDAPVVDAPSVRSRREQREVAQALMLRPVSDRTVSPNNSDNEGCGWMNSAISSTVASQFTAR